MKKNALVFVVCSVLLLTFSAVPNSAEGRCVSGNVGLALVRDSDVTFTGVSGLTLDVQSVKGPALAAAIGYSFTTISESKAKLHTKKMISIKPRQAVLILIYPVIPRVLLL